MKSILTAAVLAVGLSGAAMAGGQTHHIAVHVNQNDPQVMNMALNNVANLAKYYEEQGDDLVVEVVAYGPGVNMLVPGKSPVAERIATMSLEIGHVSFSACGNTIRAMSQKAGHDIALLDEAHLVPSGVVRLVELQQQGYAYIRP
ncbi:DsrE family protein [Pseudodonghicola flavimaris]|uniref:DsrE family protein n=1 Tax=Pseudodonghicola flavimaris TaxID=3050036 RepID=A0ABT7EYW2_9RHOB|nr:DsrE family protein [Pseudodonghicola flavimaris]MDK3017533.1 DsrE family protein [Pseudodonghicola flavimaris]